MKLDIRAFAIACGLLWGSGLFLATWWIIFLEGVQGQEFLLTRVYIGYSITPFGSLIGLLWGLLDGAVAGAILAWLYNRFSRN